MLHHPKPVAFVKLPNIKFARIKFARIKLLMVTVNKILCSQAIYIYSKCVWSRYPQNSVIFLLSLRPRRPSELLDPIIQFRLTIDTTRTRLNCYWSVHSIIQFTGVLLRDQLHGFLLAISLLSKGSHSQDSTDEEPSIICNVSQVLLIGSKAAACSIVVLRRFGCMRQTRPNPSKSSKSAGSSSHHGP